MNRTAPLPAAYSLGQLVTLTTTRFPSAHHVSTKGADLIAFFRVEPADTEVTAWRADVAAHVPVQPTPEATAANEQANQQTVLQQAETGLAQLQAIIDRADFTSTAIVLTGGNVTDLRTSVQAAMNTQRTQTQAALNILLDALRTIARIQRRLIRLALGRFDGTD